jgi:hypothetical protein
MNRFQIPAAVAPTFDELSQLSTKDAEKVASLLHQFPIGGRFEDLQKILQESQFSERLPNLDQTLFSFGKLLIDEWGEDIEALAQSLSEAFARNKEDISENIIEQLKENLLIIFEHADHLKKTFKTNYLFSENNHIYRESSIMTDTRLLFNDELENPPKCGVILHQLKIEYEEDDMRKTFFVSMDKDDITELAEVLQRALKKEEIIKKSQSNIHFITLK